MPKKGFIHIVPLVVVAVVIIGGFSSLSTLSDQRKKEAVGKVLSENSGSGSDHQSGESEDSGKSGSSNSQDQNKSEESSTTISSNAKVESKTKDTKSKIETNKNKTKIEIKSTEGKFESETEGDKQETKIETRRLKIEIKFENGQRIVKIKNEHDEEVEASPEAENELLEDANEKLEEEDIQIASDSAGLGFVHHGKKVRTNFPLTIDPTTGQLFVTTPKGTKAVAILPDTAIQNMLAAGILTRIDQPALLPSTPPGGTSSAGATTSATVAGAAIDLTQVNDQPAYVIGGVRTQNFLGLVPVDIKLKTIVSAQNGQLLDVQQGILARVLDLLSF